jgi:hypothetical protein
VRPGVGSDMATIVDGPLESLPVVVDVSSDHYERKIPNPISQVALKICLIMKAVRRTEVSGTDVVLLDVIVKIGTEGRRTVIKVELQNEPLTSAFFEQLRLRSTFETHPDDPLRGIDQILLANTLVGERTHFGVGPLQPIGISRVPVVGLRGAELGEIGRSGDRGETVEPCLREGGSRRGRARSRVLGLPFYKKIRGKIEVSHLRQGNGNEDRNQVENQRSSTHQASRRLQVPS